MKQKIGQTEMIQDSLNPEFVTEISAKYMFEEQQSMLVEVYDIDDANQINNLSKQEIVGSVQFMLGTLCSSKNQELVLPIDSSVRKNSGKITIMAEEKKENLNTKTAKMQIGA